MVRQKLLNKENIFLVKKYMQILYYFFYNTVICPLQVYSREELQMVADLCIKYNVICLSDEVYEWMVYDDNKHIKIGEWRTVWVPGVECQSLCKSTQGCQQIRY